MALASLLETRLSVEPLVMLTPSAKVSRILELVIRIESVLAPQYMQTMCSVQMLSMVIPETLEKSKTLPGPSIREV